MEAGEQAPTMAPSVVRGPAPARRPALVWAAPRPRLPWWALALLLYGALALALFAWRLIGHLSTDCACAASADPGQVMWGLQWWPWALLHGHNPFFSPQLWAPVGGNTAKSALLPGPALALAPVTLLFGPIVAYNLMTIAAPVLAAFTAYLLCRHITRSQRPALVGGFIFGFSPYLFAQLTAHANLYLVFLVPLMVLLALRRAQGELSPRRYVVYLAIVLVAQMGISTEVLATTVALGGLTLVGCVLIAPRRYGARVVSLALDTALAGILAAVVTAPYLYWAAIKGGAPIGSPGADQYGTDLLNPILPTVVTWIHGDAVFEGGHWAEAGGYLTIPLLIAFVAWLDRERRRFIARLLGVAFVVIFFLSLGSHLAVNGYGLLAWLWPYDRLTALPVVNALEPGRLSMYLTLILGIGVADWLAVAERAPARRHRTLVRRWSLVAVGLVLLLPNFPTQQWFGVPHNPAFFTTSAYKRSLTPGETDLVLPYWDNDNSMLWQAEAHFSFQTPEGYLMDSTPPPFDAIPAVSDLEANAPISPAVLLQFLERFHVRHVIDAGLDPYAATLAQLHLPEQQLDGVTIYTLAG